MRELKFYTLDVFTDVAFGGNPLAVVLGGESLETAEMQRIAREFQLSETAFVLPPQAGGDFRVRIFTPGIEMPFAGHPTIGTALLLTLLGLVPEGKEQIVLEENAGPVAVTFRWKEGKAVHAELTSPLPPERRKPEVTVKQVAEVLSLSEKDIGSSIEAVSCGVPYLIVPVKSRAALKNLRFNVPFWEKHFEKTWASAVYIFFEGQQLHTRMFAPEPGMLEDPATGSAAVCLAAYLLARCVDDGLEYTWVIQQGEDMNRPSRLEITAIRWDLNQEETRVGGGAVQLMEGTLRF